MDIKPSTKGQGQVFKNPVLERLTKTHISLPLVAFTIVSSSLIYYGIAESFIGRLEAAVLFISGFLSFTLVEYVMHRFVFHLAPKNKQQEKFAYSVHGVHHAYPKDKDRLAMPLPLSLTLAFVFFLIFRFFMGPAVFGFLPGFLMGYAAYLGVHYMVHAFQPPKNLFKILWIHHGIHHYKDPEHAFGVSSPLWDIVFRTMPRRR